MRLTKKTFHILLAAIIMHMVLIACAELYDQGDGTASGADDQPLPPEDPGARINTCFDALYWYKVCDLPPMDADLFLDSCEQGTNMGMCVYDCAYKNQLRCGAYTKCVEDFCLEFFDQ